MAVQHTVVFRLVHDAGSVGEQRFLEDARDILTSISGVHEFAIRRQVSAKSSFTHQFSMRFDDQSAYDAYDADPRHIDFVKERWVPEVAEFQEYDFTER